MEQYWACGRLFRSEKREFLSATCISKNINDMVPNHLKGEGSNQGCLCEYMARNRGLYANTASTIFPRNL